MDTNIEKSDLELDKAVRDSLQRILDEGRLKDHYSKALTTILELRGIQFRYMKTVVPKCGEPGSPNLEKIQYRITFVDHESETKITLIGK